MSLIGTLTTGVSGVLTNSRALNIIGDNISNVNTTGFKSSRAVFGDQFSTSLAGGTLTSQVGQGTQLLGSLQSFAQGAFESGTNALDLAVDGNGFFIVNDGIGNFYTRAGQFRINENGLVQTITGEILQGFPITNNVVGTTLTDVSLTGLQSAPQVTTAFTLGAQLDGSEVGILPGPAPAFTFNSPIQVFNSVGTQDILNIQFTKQDRRFEHTQGEATNLTYTLGSEADTAKIEIYNSTGALVNTFNGPGAEGSNLAVWNGLDSQGNPVTSGFYTFKIRATDASGKLVGAETFTTGLVTDVLFEEGKAFAVVNGQKLSAEEITRVSIN